MTPIEIAVAVSVAALFGIAFLSARSLFTEIDVPPPSLDSAGRKGVRGAFRAVIACAGPSASFRTHRYEGLADCRLVHKLYAGDRACKNACLGYGTCRAVCPLEAISEGADGNLRVDDLCDGCGKCAAECPTGAIRLVPREADYFVRCSARESSPSRLEICRSPCTACGECVHASADAGFSVSDGLASVDYHLTGDRSAAASSCPTGCIVALSKEGVDKNAFQGTDNGLEWQDRQSGAADADK